MSGSGALADSLRAKITSGRLAMGQPLPAEREFCVDLGVSRTTLRAALAQLEADGLVERRVGRGGGTFVSGPGAQEVTATLQRAVGLSGFSARDLAEARMEIEPTCAKLAAVRISAEELDALNALQSAVVHSTARKDFFEANARFHLLIAEASGNAVLSAIISGLLGPIRDMTDDPVRIGDEEMAETVHVHQLLIASLSTRDEAGAEAIMRSHLRAHADVVSSESLRPQPRS